MEQSILGPNSDTNFFPDIKFTLEAGTMLPIIQNITIAHKTKLWNKNRIRMFCSEQVLSCCQNRKSCILCNYSKNLGFVGLIRSNIVHPHETARISFQRL